MILLLAFLIFLLYPFSSSISLTNGNATMSLDFYNDNGILIRLSHGGVAKLDGWIGVGQKSLKQIKPSNKNIKVEITNGDVTLLVSDDTPSGFGVYWVTLSTSTALEDCIYLEQEQVSWFGGVESTSSPTLAIQNLKIRNADFTVKNTTPVSEPYFLSSRGAFVFVNQETPLFLEQNTVVQDSLCLFARVQHPYNTDRLRVVLNYTIGVNANIREAHRNAIDNLIGRPTGQPESSLMRFPVWSTWAKYRNDINDQLVYELAENLHGYKFRGMLEIDDGWEDCHGSLSFNKRKFAQIKKTVISINSFAMQVILLIHPFVNDECEDTVKIAQQNGYFVSDSKGNDMISWWNSSKAHLIDFSNKNATQWYLNRVSALLKQGIQGYKFDGGETNWILPLIDASSRSSKEIWPNQLTTNYIAISNITKIVSAHCGWRTQRTPVMVRIPEKESNWSKENGLASIIINLIQLNLLGYPMVVTPLIGGVGEAPPNAELYVRWVQASVFMPVMRFGHLPWEIISFDFDVLEIVRKCIDLHNWYSDKIKNVLKHTQYMGLPANGPIWWIDYSNSNAFAIDDQYLLGEDFLIAPVLMEGAVTRNVYLPPGTWRDGNNQSIKYKGGKVLENYPAPIQIIPFFIKERQ